jgi:putative membrane protein
MLGAAFAAPKSVETAIGEALGDPEQDAPELFAVRTGRVIGSIVLSFVPGLVMAVVVVVAATASGRAEVLAPLGLPVAFGLASLLWGRLISDFSFTAKQTARGLTLSHGLTTRVAQTIPPGGILALEISQPLMWRPAGWWRMRMNVVGYDNDAMGVFTLLLPVGDVETVRRALWAVAPAMAQPGVWEGVTAAMTKTGPTPGFVGAPQRSRWLDPVTWRRNAVTVTSDALLIRSGAWRRRAVLVLHARLQSIELRQGPLERRLGLASARLYSVVGPVVPYVNHFASADADRLVRDETRRLNAALNGS